LIRQDEFQPLLNTGRTHLKLSESDKLSLRAKRRIKQGKMKLKPQITLIDHFSKLTDPRIDRTKEHKLIGRC
jgi:hypothetical protein